jgi:hypothetical protein
LSNFAEIAPILKHPSFKEEKEWRLISPLINSFNDNVKFRTGKSMIIPYIEFSLADENNKIDFEEIIIGPTPHLELSKMSTQLLLVKSGFDENDSKKVKISKIPYRDW